MALTARCPVCEIDMKQVSARADPGRLIVLDQCARCGGVWCDKWELFPIAPEEAKRIDPLSGAGRLRSAASSAIGRRAAGLGGNRHAGDFRLS